MKKIKNIIFDFGGVLVEPKSGHWFVTPNFYQIIDEKLIDKNNLRKILKENTKIQTQKPKTELEEYEMFVKYYSQVLTDFNYLDLSKAEELAKDCVYNDGKFIMYDDVIPNLEKLSKEYNLYIISNGWPSSHRILKILNIEKYFEDIFISSMYGLTKEEGLFKVFLDKHNINPEESIYIDDREYVLDCAKEYNFNLLKMCRNEVEESKYKIITKMDQIKID